CRHDGMKSNARRNRDFKPLKFDVSRNYPSGRHQQYPVESDYINASYVNSMSKKNAYIAAQGPNRKSVSDFWDMIWQENCYCIVMATSLFEHARQQCEKYWHNEHGRYGNTEVWLEHSDLLCDFNVRTFRLRRVSEIACNEDDRIIKQFQYACWSEHDVPNASALLEFRRRIHVFHRTRTGPIVVHCGNGAGRTGAFIALDAVLEQASVEKNIDIFSYVMYLRSCRQTMVRTPLQYEFIYDCVSMHMQCGSTVIGAKELHHVIPLLSAKTPKTGLSGFETEYRTLEYIVPKLTVGECAGGHRLENRRKSRDVMVQPPERSRPYLITHDSNDSTDYINAVYADGYRNSNAYVVTQWPMRKTVNDIWRLIYDYNIPTLVVLNDCPNSTNYPSFWPVEHAKEVTYGPLTVEFVDQDKSDKHVSSKLFRIKKTLVSLQAMANGGEESSRLVRMFQIHSWPNSQQVPNDSTAIIDLLSKVEDWQVNQCHGRIPTCVLSRDGISRCGIYLTASIAWEKLKAEGEIDVFNAVKVVKTNRPALIPNLAEYIYCYTFMLVLLEILTATRPNLIPINQMLDDTWEKRDKAAVDPPSGKGDCPTPTPSHLIQKQNDVVLEEEVPQGASAQPMELILCVPEIHASREQLIPEMDSDGHDNPAVDNDDILYCSHL
ncbi:hypothetical protein CAPTEDRAFT_136827, partial [Capitella teleta]